MNLLAPNKIKYKKNHKPFIIKKINYDKYLSHGTFGLQALESGLLNSIQIEALRKAVIKRVKKIGKGKIWLKIFPYVSLTKKPAETRMGKGKGSHYMWVSPVKPGYFLLEIFGPEVSFDTAYRSCKFGADKLPIKTRFIYKELPPESIIFKFINRKKIKKTYDDF